MTKKWAFAAKNEFSSFSSVHWLKRCFMKPLHVFLVLAGVALIIFAANAHATTPSSVSLSTHEVFMQAGSELPFVVRVDIPFGKDTRVSFDVDYPSSVLRVDGELNSIVTPFSLSRDAQIIVKPDALPGDYFITLRTRLDSDSETVVDVQTIRVHVEKKGLVSFFTSDNTTLSSRVSSPSFSATRVELGRNENASVLVSFVNAGSTTDYLIRLSEPSLYVPVHIVNETHRFVEQGERAESLIEISTKPTTEFGTYVLRVEAYDLVSGEKTYLGTILVDVTKTINVDVSFPFREVVVEKNSVGAYSLTVTNTEYADFVGMIETSSSLTRVAQRQIHVPAKSSLTIPVSIEPSPVLGMRNETIYVMDAQLTREVSFLVNTVDAPVASAPITDSNSTTFPSSSAVTGFVTRAFSSWLGFIIIILAALVVFSPSFRDQIVKRLPKPLPPAKKKEDAKPLKPIDAGAAKIAAQDPGKVVSSAPADAPQK